MAHANRYFDFISPRSPSSVPALFAGLLRPAIASGCGPGVIRTIFEASYRDGADLVVTAFWTRLTESPGVTDPDARIGDPAVEDAAS